VGAAITTRRPQRFPLVAMPTPVQRAQRLEAALGSPPLYVKRDDLTGFAVAGNKARKLELLIADALEQGADVVLTGGGTGSNHCHATAAAARVAGLDCVLVYYGEEPDDEPPGLRFARGFGPEVRFTGDPRRESVDECLDAFADRLRESGRRPYVIPRGGATALGAAAYGAAAEELAAQLNDLGVRPAVVVVATGSGGTQAGLVAGTVAVGAPWRVIGASVSRPVDECRERVLRLAREAAGVYGWPAASGGDIDVRDARHPGYGVPSAAGRDAALLAARREGLLLDPVFTAKAMAETIRFLSEGVEGTAGGAGMAGIDGPIVFWHTGGLLAALGEALRPASEPTVETGREARHEPAESMGGPHDQP